MYAELRIVQDLMNSVIAVFYKGSNVHIDVPHCAMLLMTETMS